MRLKHFLSVFLTLLTLSVGQMWGAVDETITFSSVCSADESLHEGSKTGTDFSVYFNKGTNSNAPVYKTTGSAVRVYGGGYFIVSSTTKTITKIELTFGSGDGSNAITTEDKAYENSVWEGSASSVTFTVGGTTGHRRLASVAVTYASNVSYDVHWNVNGQNITTVSTSGKPTVPSGAKSAAEAFDCNGKVFVGWSSASVTGSAPADLFSEQAGSAISGETTYNAVFATATPGAETDAFSTLTVKTASGPESPYEATDGTTWTFSGLTFANTNSAGVAASANASIEMALPNTASCATSVTITGTGQAWAGSAKAYFTLTGSGVNGSIGSLNKDAMTYTFSAADKTANKDKAGTYTLTKGGANGAWIQSITINYKKQNVTYSNYSTTCCTSLGQINGSVTLSQLSPNAVEGKLQAGWQLEKTTGIGSLKLQLFKKGSPDAQVGNDIDVSSQISTNAETYTFEGLDHCATYYVNLVATKDGGTYCSNGWEEQSNDATTLGYAVTISDTDGEVYDGSDLMGVYGADKENACAGETVTLTALNETGYHFASWSVTKTNGGAAVAMTGDNTFTMPAEAVTVAATFESDATPIGITLTPNAKATLSATVGGNAATEAYAGETVTLACTDIASGYQFVGWNVTAGGDPVTVTNNTFTMPSSAVTVVADVRQTVTVTFKRDGSDFDTKSTYSGGTVTFPENPSKFDDNYPNFIGWAEAIDGIATSAPTLKSASDAITENVDYHAVFSSTPVATGNYVKITTLGELTDGKYVIVGEDNTSKNLAILKSEVYNQYYVVGTALTLTDGKIANPATKSIFDFEYSTEQTGWTIKYDDTEGGYLALVVSNTHTNLKPNQNNAHYFTAAVNEGAWTLTSKTTSSPILYCLYNNSTPEFLGEGNYTSNNIYLYKQEFAQDFVTRAIVKHTISYSSNGLSESEYEGDLPESEKVVDGDGYTISTATLSRDGYNFKGWNSSNTATTAETTLTNVTADVTLYAVWEEIPTYDIEFSVNGAPVAALKIDDILQGTAITFPDAAAITAASAFPATDKKFVGWIEASSYASDVAPTFVTSATATANKTYYAVFADVEGDDIVDEYDDASTFPFALWEKTNNRGQKSGAEAWQMYGDKGGNPEGEINTLSTYSNLVSLSFNAKTGSNSTTLTIYYSADKSTWTQLTTKAISENTTYSDYSIDLSTIPSGAKYIKVKNSTNSFFIKSITLTQGAVSDYVTNISPLSSIAITTAPTKTVYKKGQMLNLENMVVTATYENSRTRPVTNYTVTPSTTTALATTDESFTVSYTEGEITRTDDQEIHVYELSGIAITNPTKTTYNAGETFDPEGMTVTATWGGSALDKIAETVDSYTYSPSTAFVNETDEDINVDVTISYTHEGVTKTATQVVTVHPLANLTMTWNVAGETSTSKIYINGDEQYLLALPEEDPEVPEAFGTGYEFIGWTSDATIAKDGQGINWAANNDVMTVATEFKAVFAQVNAPFFKETFDDCDGTGGNDGSWSGNIASSTFKADNTWTTVKSYGGDQCARIGGSSDQGSATTPTFSMTGSGKLVFKAGAFDGDQTTLNLSATGATLASSSVTLQSAAWDNYEIAITNATGSVTITFQGKQASKARFFLDEVEVKNGDAEYSNYRFVPSSVAVPVITLEESTYYGAQNATITQAQEKQIFYSLDNNTWTEYTEPVALDQAGAVTLYAKAYDADQDDYSSVVSKSYTIVTEIDAPTMTASCVFIDDQTVTISHDMSGTEGFALQYSYDGENYTAYTEALTVTETTTIYAKATIGSLEATANATYTKGHPVDYTKVTSAAGLAIGQQFIIKAVGVNAAAGALGSDVLAAVDIPEEVSNIITLINEPVTVFELGGRSGAYTLISDGKYLKYKSDKKLEYSTTVADTWTITYSDGTPTIKNVTNSSYSLQYNSSSPRFTVYTSAQTAVAIYAKAATVYTLTVKDYDGSNMLTEKVVEGGSFILTEADEPSDAESGYEFLNKWTDGTNTYAVGDAVEVSANMTLNPCWKVTPTDAVIDIDGLPEGVKEIVVGEGKDLNVNDDKTYDNVTVQAGGKISGDNTLSVNNLTIKSEIKAEVNAGSKSGQVMNANKVTASAVYMDVRFYSKNDATELGADEANVWYSISAPFDVSLNGGFFQTDGTPMVFGTDFDLFEYDGKKRADTGVTGWKRAQGKMSAGVACLIGFNESQPTTIRLKAASNTLTNPGTIDLKTYSSSEGANANWNGVANPTLHYTTLDKDAQYFNNNTRGWETCTPSAYSFVVGTAFFVHSDVDITLSSTINGTLRAPRRNEGETRYEYGVRITSTTDPYSTNNMFVRASEDASASYQAGHDLQTLNGETAACALIYAKNYGMRLAIEEAPIVNGEASYQIGLYAPVSGEYRIEANDTYDNADLYLTYEGSIIWNLSMGEYELDLNKGTTNGYGLLLQAKAPQTPTGVEQSEVSHQPSDIQKIIINDNVFILRGGQMYDVTGKAVK